MPTEETNATQSDRTVVVLLPGLHGTPGLFDRFVAECPGRFSTEVIGLPTGEPLSYDALEEYVIDRLPRARRMLLLGESFSGPLAIRVASRKPPGVVGVVLSASFVRRPAPALLGYLPWKLMFTVPAPAFALRYFLTGPGDRASLVPEVLASIEGVPAAVLASRIRSVLSVDVTAELAGCEVPILYLQGSRDRLVRRWCLRRVKKTRADVESCTIDAPHLVLQFAPKESWRCIEEFAQSAG